VQAFNVSGNASLSVSNSSSRVALPTGDDTVLVANSGSTDCYVKLGSASVIAATTDLFVGSGRAITLATGSATYLAAITAASTTTLQIAQGVGVPALGAKTGGGGSGSPGGSSGQIQYNNSGSFGGFTASGDATINTATGAVSVTKTGGSAFAASATTDTTNAANISSGKLPQARLTASAGDGFFFAGNFSSTTSTTGVLMGMGTNTNMKSTTTGSAAGVLLAIATTGRVTVTMSFMYQQATGAAINTFQIYYNDNATVAAPANGTAVTSGVALGAVLHNRSAGTNVDANGLTITATITGLTVGHSYWFDLGVATGAGADAITVGDMNVTAIES
jgi:hypothetical protein